MPSNYPGGFSTGLTVQNLSILNTYPGKILWVDSTGQSTGAGTFNSPFSTIAQAYARCTAGDFDMIMVKPGHTETIIAAGGITLDKAGVQIYGLGHGRTRPRINFTTSTAATLLVTGAQNMIANFIFDLTGIDALAGPLAVQAADFQLLGCEIITASATNQTTLGVLTTSAADRMIIQGNRFIGTSDAGTTAAIRIVGGDRIELLDNEFFGAYGSGVGAIENLTTATTNILISGNTIINATAGSTKAIVAVAGTTGMIQNNRLGILSGTAPITSAGAYWSGNYYAAAVATAGTLV